MYINSNNMSKISHNIQENNILNMTYTIDSPIIKPLCEKPHNNEIKMDNVNIQITPKWIDDNSVTKCFECNKFFSFLLRRHHCRICGRVFCYECSNFFTPSTDILNKHHKTPHNIMNIFNTQNNIRTCGGCFVISNKLIGMRKIIKIFEICNFNIVDLILLSKMIPKWKNACEYLLSKFKEIQYKLHIEELNLDDKKQLWNNRKLLIGHSCWLVYLVKSRSLCNYENKVNCKYIKCIGSCSHTPNITDILSLIRYNNNNTYISNIIINYMNGASINNIIYYLPSLVHNIKNNIFLLDILINFGNSNYNFMSQLYWCIKVYCLDINKNAYINTLVNKIDATMINRFKEMLKMEKLNINEINKNERIILPLCHDKYFIDVESNVIVMQSNSQPVIATFIDNTNTKKQIMFKSEDIRKDHIITNIINIIHDILKKENIIIDIIQYEVVPTSKNSGYIEIIEKSATIYNIINSGCTIQNYILNHNKNQTIGVFREKIVKSTALYCVVSYLLGIGDRHLDNIMISRNGLLFHIDFGYILGQDPKYSTNRLLRVTPEIINVIGGYGSDDYNYFKEMCIKIYNILRLHVNLFANLLYIIPAIDPTITFDILKHELTERFEIGESCLEAATHMDVKVDNKYNFEYMIIDFLYSSKQTMIYKGLKYVTNTILSRSVF